MIKKIFSNIPNTLTILRILLIPILISSFYFDYPISHYFAAIIFISASITDYFDGSLARRWNAETDFGRMLDPIADKMLVVSTLLMLVDQKSAPVIPIVIIICREFFISGIREYFAVTHHYKIKVNRTGKIKTILQMIAIVMLLLQDENFAYFNIYSLGIGHYVLWIASMLSLISGYQYIRSGFNYIKRK